MMVEVTEDVAFLLDLWKPLPHRRQPLPPRLISPLLAPPWTVSNGSGRPFLLVLVLTFLEAVEVSLL